MIVSRNKLGQLALIAQGTFGKVFRVLHFTLDGGRTPLAYKEFLPTTGSEAVDAAQTAVTFRAGLSASDQGDLDRYAAWPRALVEDGPGQIVGFLMPLLVNDFFISLPDPPSTEVRDLNWLIATPDQLRANKVEQDIDHVERLLLLAQLCYAIGRLHKHGWVYGDLSYMNAAFALDPPRLMLLDCDGSARLTDPNRQQGTTPYWEVPELEGSPPVQTLQDCQTDVFKLALATLRGLTPGRMVSTARNVKRLDGILPPNGIELVRRALSPNRSERPTAKELFVYLADTVTVLTSPPEIDVARVVNPVCFSGQDVVLAWKIRSATEIVVRALGRPEVRLDPGAYPDGYVFKAPHSTEVVVEAGNRYGTARAELGLVMVFDLPEVKVALPGVSTPSMAAAGAHLAEMSEPIARSEFPRPVVPALPRHDLEAPLREVLAASGIGQLQSTAGNGLDQAHRAVARSASQVGRQVTESADELRELLGKALESALREKLPSALKEADR
ncbi:hypothetical protein F1D05_26180 [Kribbella qitaiheensis]|uniref:Protein kinase domain-containing protein n=1 Tax=Kribbella qitaiheensis TaxID=1544730 RepID=A0A7G6X3E7_9ACTN|nr:hypothetical protein [Kribbella qitaiheensis]QNE20762.1 hypothetical protein F1D05_26180 [Kribbella qitaiheensis]